MCSLVNIRNRLLRLALSVLILLSASLSQARELVTYYHTDLQGSTIAASDESGNVIWEELYRPYGQQEFKHGSDKANAHGYTGKAQSLTSGLVYMGARYYDPAIGRFLSPDPVHFIEENPQSFNRYAYANNNPYKYVDPDGRLAMFIPILWVIGAEAVGIALDVAFMEPTQDSITPSMQGIPGPLGKALGHGLSKIGGRVAGNVANTVANFSQKQLAKKFKHASDFGVDTAKKNPRTLAEFQSALATHLGDTATVQKGTYGFVQDSMVFFNSKTNNAVVLDKAGEFITGFKLSPGTKQFENYMSNGLLR